ncbi:TetR/AcrR family transcriptional regulator [Ideonella sp. DXS22W]|uniref:TetR/AcrR family transcriptional regulator n=1 Tax=Pseudaquabacterium inlustre TaxID=2984192 RepID=A0ABU9CM01_9BURK
MPRPSQQLDQALLRSGRALYPQLGCAGLSQRRVAEHAGVAPGMFHYHFESKNAFLRAVLQQLYEELFAGLSAQAELQGPVLARLRGTLLALAQFVRAQRPLLVRLATDAAAGEAVATEFVRDNMPRHLGLLLGLVAEAQREGRFAAGPPLGTVAFLMGAVMAPLMVAPTLAALAPAMAGLAGVATGASPDPAPDRTAGAAPEAPVDAADRVAAAVGSDAAIATRIDLALAALQGAAR